MVAILSFICSFVVSTAGALIVLNSQSNEIVETQPQVLAEAIQSTTEPSPKPTITPTVKPKTPTSTSTPTAVSITTPIISPAPSGPTATSDVWPPGHLEPWFAQYAGQYGIDKNLLERIANCESHFNPEAINKDYVGMFQFATSTWINYRAQMGLDTNPDLRTNPEEAIKTGAFVVSKRGSAPWPACV